MFDDVDESLRALLVEDVPLDPAEVEISFDRPTREWSGRLAGPTLNLFLFDVRERTDFRDDTWRVSRTEAGQVTRERMPRRVDLSYMVTAWTREPEDEHRILGRVLACLYRNLKLPIEHYRGALRDIEMPVPLRTMPPDHHQKATDFWGVMDNELHTNLTWVATVPLDAFRPLTGPMVRTRTLRFERTGARPPDSEGDLRSRELHQVGGIVHREGEPGDGVAGVTLALEGSTAVATTATGGRYDFTPLAEGEYRVRVEGPDGTASVHELRVPSESYDIPLGGAGGRESKRARKSSKEPPGE